MIQTFDQIRNKSWIPRGIKTSYSLTKRGRFKSFENLKREFNLDRSDLFRYLQIRHHFDHNIKNKTDFSDPIVRLFIDAYQNNLAKGVISDFYDSFLEKKKT